ncbi:hypothetical protein [Niallia circulans]|uniref:hypothetical protein n=1 Tax=Niallia circulans TaxID=1397 RepID=UPI0026EB3366|nr:hypothetical protein [Niallia circulans]
MESNLNRINTEIIRLIRKHSNEGSELERDLLKLAEVVDEEKRNQLKLRELAFKLANSI